MQLFRTLSQVLLVSAILSMGGGCGNNHKHGDFPSISETGQDAPLNPSPKRKPRDSKPDNHPSEQLEPSQTSSVSAKEDPEIVPKETLSAHVGQGALSKSLLKKSGDPRLCKSFYDNTEEQSAPINFHFNQQNSDPQRKKSGQDFSFTTPVKLRKRSCSNNMRSALATPPKRSCSNDTRSTKHTASLSFKEQLAQISPRKEKLSKPKSDGKTHPSGSQPNSNPDNEIVKHAVPLQAQTENESAQNQEVPQEQTHNERVKAQPLQSEEANKKTDNSKENDIAPTQLQEPQKKTPGLFTPLLNGNPTCSTSILDFILKTPQPLKHQPMHQGSSLSFSDEVKTKECMKSYLMNHGVSSEEITEDNLRAKFVTQLEQTTKTVERH